MKKLFEDLDKMDEFVDVMDPQELEMTMRFIMNFGRRFQGPLSQDWRAFAAQAQDLLKKMGVN